jgi:hypothetical protein
MLRVVRHTTGDRTAAHRKLDRRHDDLCGAGLRKRAFLENGEITGAMRRLAFQRRVDLFFRIPANQRKKLS